MTTCAAFEPTNRPPKCSIAGGELRFIMNAPEPLLIHVDEATRPTVVRWTLIDCPFLTDWIGTKPTFAIRPIDSETTQVRFHHQGLNQELECIDMCTRSWARYVASLLDYLETGGGSPFGSPGDKACREAQARETETSIHQEAVIGEAQNSVGSDRCLPLSASAAHVSAAGMIGPTLRGRVTSSPLQIGHLPSIASPQLRQKVYS
jgi:hypothetical protein